MCQKDKIKKSKNLSLDFLCTSTKFGISYVITLLVLSFCWLSSQFALVFCFSYVQREFFQNDALNLMHKPQIGRNKVCNFCVKAFSLVFRAVHDRSSAVAVLFVILGHFH